MERTRWAASRPSINSVWERPLKHCRIICRSSRTLRSINGCVSNHATNGVSSGGRTIGSYIFLGLLAHPSFLILSFVVKSTPGHWICHSQPTGFFQTVSPRACVLFHCGSTLWRVEQTTFLGQIKENAAFRLHEEPALLLAHVSLLSQAMRLRQYQVHPGWRKDQLDTLPGEYHVRYERLISRRCACDRCLLLLVRCVTA